MDEKLFKNIEVKTYTDKHYGKVVNALHKARIDRYFVKDWENGVREIIFREREEEPANDERGLSKHAVIKSLPDIDIDKAEALAISTDYATFAVGEDVNTADAGAFFLEGYLYAQRLLGNVL